MPTLVRVEISQDGMEVYPAALQPNLPFKYGLFSRKLQAIGPISFGYGLNGGIRRIGALSVEYNWSGQVKNVSGKDARVEVIVYTRPATDGAKTGKSNRS